MTQSASTSGSAREGTGVGITVPSKTRRALGGRGGVVGSAGGGGGMGVVPRARKVAASASGGKGGGWNRGGRFEWRLNGPCLRLIKCLYGH